MANSGARVPAIAGADDDSERRVGVFPRVGLSLIGSVVVALERLGVVILEEVGELVLFPT